MFWLLPFVDFLRNLIAFTDHGSDPYVRLYLLPDKRRSGRRKTPTVKKNLNPVYDVTWVHPSHFFFFQPFDKQSKAQKKFTVSFCLFRFEFSVSLVELHRRNLDVAVKNGGGLLSKHKGLLGKVQTSLIYCLYLCVTEKHFFNTMKPSEWKFRWFWEKPHFVRLCLKVQVLLFFLLLVSYFYEVHHFDCIRKRCGFVFVCF